jgi:hypothetical protein
MLLILAVVYGTGIVKGAMVSWLSLILLGTVRNSGKTNGSDEIENPSELMR